MKKGDVLNNNLAGLQKKEKEKMLEGCGIWGLNQSEKQGQSEVQQDDSREKVKSVRNRSRENRGEAQGQFHGLFKLLFSKLP